MVPFDRRQKQTTVETLTHIVSLQRRVVGTRRKCGRVCCFGFDGRGRGLLFEKSKYLGRVIEYSGAQCMWGQIGEMSDFPLFFGGVWGAPSFISVLPRHHIRSVRRVSTQQQTNSPNEQQRGHYLLTPNQSRI